MGYYSSLVSITTQFIANSLNHGDLRLLFIFIQLQKFNKKALKVSDEVEAYYIGRKDMGRLGVTQKTAIVTEAIRKHKAEE